jgi:translation elongation factor EF-G
MSAMSKNRRVEMQQQPPQVSYNPNINSQSQSQQQSKQIGTGLTLPQVISVIDNRLINLENFVKDSRNEQEQEQTNAMTAEIPSEFIEEVQTRFEMLAREISDLKDVILKLQTFTMDVNKALYEERINILSDLGENTMVENIELNN